MKENKELNRQTNFLLFLNFFLVVWNSCLALYHFANDRPFLGIFLVIVTSFCVWTTNRLFRTKHETERLRMEIQKWQSEIEYRIRMRIVDAENTGVSE